MAISGPHVPSPLRLNRVTAKFPMLSKIPSAYQTIINQQCQKAFDTRYKILMASFFTPNSRQSDDSGVKTMFFKGKLV